MSEIQKEKFGRHFLVSLYISLYITCLNNRKEPFTLNAYSKRTVFNSRFFWFILWDVWRMSFESLLVRMINLVNTFCVKIITFHLIYYCVILHFSYWISQQPVNGCIVRYYHIYTYVAKSIHWILLNKTKCYQNVCLFVYTQLRWAR